MTYTVWISGVTPPSKTQMATMQDAKVNVHGIGNLKYHRMTGRYYWTMNTSNSASNLISYLHDQGIWGACWHEVKK